MDRTSLRRQSRCFASLLRLAALQKEHVRKRLQDAFQQLDKLQGLIAEEQARILGISRTQRVSSSAIARSEGGCAGHSAQKALAFVSTCSCMRLFCEDRLRLAREQSRSVRSDVAALSSAFDAQRIRAELLRAGIRALRRIRYEAAEMLTAHDLEDRFSRQQSLRSASLNKEL